MKSSSAASSRGSGTQRRSPYQQLKESIFLGDLQPSQQLLESTLAETYDVSRTPVREALVRLEQDGLVVRSRDGLFVREHTPAEVLDLYQVRILLEGAAGQAAAERRTEHDLMALRKAAKRYESVDVMDPRGLVETNHDFHQAVWRAGHQEALEDLLERLELRLGRFPMTTLTYPGRLQQTIDQHRAIVQAIVDRNVEQASALCAEHFTEARAIRLSLWENDV